MAKVIAFTNQKGGVGKTTSCINLAAALAATKRKILLIDLDPQGNATVGSGIEKNTLEATINDVLLGTVSVNDVIKETSGEYQIISANSDLTEAEVLLLQRENKETCLLHALSQIENNYDFIFIDCPPALNMLTFNALVAADSVFIPMQCEYFALEGLASLLNTIEQIQTTANSKLQIEGVLRTMYDRRNRLALEVSEQLEEYFGEKLYRTIIPRNVRLAEAPSYGVPILLHDRHSTGSIAFLALAGELLRKQKTNSKKIIEECPEEI